MKRKKIIRNVIICIIILIALYTNMSDSMTDTWINTINWLGLIISIPFFIHSVSKRDEEYAYMAFSFLAAFLYVSVIGVYFDSKHNEVMRIIFALCSIVASIAMFLWVIGKLKSIAMLIWESKLFLPVRFLFKFLYVVSAAILLVILMWYKSVCWKK